MFAIAIASLILFLVVRSIPESSQNVLVYAMIAIVSMVVIGFLGIAMLADKDSTTQTGGTKPTGLKPTTTDTEKAPRPLTRIVTWARDAVYYWWICFKNTRRNREHSQSCNQKGPVEEDKKPIFSRYPTRLK